VTFAAQNMQTQSPVHCHQYTLNGTTYLSPERVLQVELSPGPTTVRALCRTPKVPARVVLRQVVVKNTTRLQTFVLQIPMGGDEADPNTEMARITAPVAIIAQLPGGAPTYSTFVLDGRVYEPHSTVLHATLPPGTHTVEAKTTVEGRTMVGERSIKVHVPDEDGIPTRQVFHLQLKPTAIHEYYFE
ncbi:MAG: hypothetical protein AAFS10_17875, partial [Myxococcota bacterium]